MANLLETGAAWLADQLATNAGQTVTYIRGGDETDLVAVLGRTQFEQADAYGAITEIQSADFLIATADLILAGATELPVAGDRIVATVGGVECVYEVMAFGSEPPWRYSDPHHTMLRIHTKKISRE